MRTGFWSKDPGVLLSQLATCIRVSSILPVGPVLPGPQCITQGTRFVTGRDQITRDVQYVVVIVMVFWNNLPLSAKATRKYMHIGGQGGEGARLGPAQTVYTSRAICGSCPSRIWTLVLSYVEISRLDVWGIENFTQPETR